MSVIDKVKADDRIYVFHELQILWRAKFLIIGCAILAGLVAYIGASIWPKTYEVSVIARPANSSSFVELSTVMTDSPGDWHSPANIPYSAYQLFLQNIRSKVNLEAALSSHRTLFRNANFEDRKTLSDLANDMSVISTDPKTNTTDTFIKITFRYGSGTQGGEFLNSYVDETKRATASQIAADSLATLRAFRTGKQRDLERFREQRDVATKQQISRYEDALATAEKAGIERPIVANLGSTAAVVAGNSQVPLYYYGTVILASEIKNFEAHIGDDLAIPEFAAIESSLKDVDARLAALTQLKNEPVIVSEYAFDFDSPKSPPRGILTLGFLLVGALCGYLWSVGRTNPMEIKESRRI